MDSVLFQITFNIQKIYQNLTNTKVLFRYYLLTYMLINIHEMLLAGNNFSLFHFYLKLLVPSILAYNLFI